MEKIKVSKKKLQHTYWHWKGKAYRKIMRISNKVTNEEVYTFYEDKSIPER